jgi:hypothetical protein
VRVTCLSRGIGTYPTLSLPQPSTEKAAIGIRSIRLEARDVDVLGSVCIETNRESSVRMGRADIVDGRAGVPGVKLRMCIAN